MSQNKRIKQERFFNNAGLIKPDLHYHIDTLSRLDWEEISHRNARCILRDAYCISTLYKTKNLILRFRKDLHKHQITLIRQVLTKHILLFSTATQIFHGKKKSCYRWFSVVSFKFLVTA
jgi:hypothetical protein